MSKRWRINRDLATRCKYFLVEPNERQWPIYDDILIEPLKKLIRLANAEIKRKEKSCPTK